MLEHVALRAGRAYPLRSAFRFEPRTLVLLASLAVAPLLACNQAQPEADAATDATPDAGAVQSGKPDAASSAPDAAGGAIGPTPGLDAATSDAALTSDASPPDAGRAPDAAAANDASFVDGAVDAQASGDAAATGAPVVGTRRLEIAGPGARRLPVQLWYPAQEAARVEAERGHALEELEPAGPRREQLKALVAAARAGCPNLTFHAALEAPPLAQSSPFPLVVYSHHFSGSRFSMFEIAESLVREGLVVAAPDHVNGSLFDRKDSLTDSLTQLNNDFLQLRVADLKRVLDTLLDASAQQVPADLRGRLDPARVGAIGHSQGGMTVGVLSVEDPRVRATAYLAIPPSATPAGLVFQLPDVARFRTPGLYLTAHEDTVVAGSGGDQAIATCFEGQAPRAYWVDVKDTGHFSFADDCALAPEFDECCGTGKRAMGGASFMFLAPERARSIAARYSAAFFAAELQGATPTRLTTPEPAELVSVKQHGQRDAGP